MFLSLQLQPASLVQYRFLTFLRCSSFLSTVFSLNGFIAPLFYLFVLSLSRAYGCSILYSELYFELLFLLIHSVVSRRSEYYMYAMLRLFSNHRDNLIDFYLTVELFSNVLSALYTASGEHWRPQEFFRRGKYIRGDNIWN